MNNKRTLVNLYPSTHFLYDIVYQQQHKSRDLNQCLSKASDGWSIYNNLIWN